MPAEPIFRLARIDDLPAIVALVTDDFLGATREGDPADPRYREAFLAIEQAPNTDFYVLEADGAVVGCAQLTFTPGLTYVGRLRAEIETVQIASDRRGGGLGSVLIGHLLDVARARGAGSVQLSSNKRRTDAHRFYERLGFQRSHEGFKLELCP